MCLLKRIHRSISPMTSRSRWEIVSSGPARIKIVDCPEFDSFKVFWETNLDQGAMFGFLHGHDMICRIEVWQRGLRWKP